MGTRSMIGVEIPNSALPDSPTIMDRGQRTIMGIYCHWDGYPSHNGKILLEHYDDHEKLLQLMELGDLSVLGAEIGEKHPFDRPLGDGDPYEGMCTAYKRDRGEENVDARTFASRDEFLQYDIGAQYWYLYTLDGKWLYAAGYGGKGSFKELTPAVCEDKDS